MLQKYDLSVANNRYVISNFSRISFRKRLFCPHKFRTYSILNNIIIKYSKSMDDTCTKSLNCSPLISCCRRAFNKSNPLGTQGSCLISSCFPTYSIQSFILIIIQYIKMNAALTTFKLGISISHVRTFTRKFVKNPMD